MKNYFEPENEYAARLSEKTKGKVEWRRLPLVGPRMQVCHLMCISQSAPMLSESRSRFRVDVPAQYVKATD